jgi:hypothetical protein
MRNTETGQVRYWATTRPIRRLEVAHSARYNICKPVTIALSSARIFRVGETVALLLKRLLGLFLIIATLVYFFGPLFGAPWRIGRYDLAAVVIIYSSLSAWIIGIQMRRKIRRDLGRKATSADLTSINTWMKVEEVEERNKEKNPLG